MERRRHAPALVDADGRHLRVSAGWVIQYDLATFCISYALPDGRRAFITNEAGVKDDKLLIPHGPASRMDFHTLVSGIALACGLVAGRATETLGGIITIPFLDPDEYEAKPPSVPPTP